MPVVIFCVFSKNMKAGEKTGYREKEKNREDIAMDMLSLNEELINNIKKDIVYMVKNLMGNELVEVILYGSCARGDYTNDSDIDIALLIRCDRMKAKMYGDGLASIATELAMRYFAVVNLVCFPYQEFLEKKSWYAYFQNIDREGIVLYG